MSKIDVINKPCYKLYLKIITDLNKIGGCSLLKLRDGFPKWFTVVIWLILGLVIGWGVFSPKRNHGLAWGADNAATDGKIDQAVDNILNQPDEPISYLPPGEPIKVRQPNPKSNAWDNLVCGAMVIHYGADREAPKILLDRVDEVIAAGRGCLEPHFTDHALFVLCVETKYHGKDFSVYLIRLNRNGRRYWEAQKKVCK